MISTKFDTTEDIITQIEEREKKTTEFLNEIDEKSNHLNKGNPFKNEKPKPNGGISVEHHHRYCK